MRIIPKYKDGDYIAKQDKIQINKPEIHDHIKFIPKPIEQLQPQLYDKDKIDFYKDLQDYYNYNAFGYGISGNQTRFNPITQQDQIKSNFEYAGRNAENFAWDVVGSAIPGIYLNRFGKIYAKIFKTPFMKLSPRENLGALSRYTKSGTIGQGAEAVVVKDSPITVGKFTSIPRNEMAVRNAIPNVVPSTCVGFVKDGNIKLPTYVQRKVKVLNKDTFQKYVSKLDDIMKKSNFRIINDPQVQYRAYTNGKLVIDDIAPGNVGLNLFRKPKIIDFNLQTVPEWIEQGFTLN